VKRGQSWFKLATAADCPTDSPSRPSPRVRTHRPCRAFAKRGVSTMKTWSKPAFENLRYGFEINLYVKVR